MLSQTFLTVFLPKSLNASEEILAMLLAMEVAIGLAFVLFLLVLCIHILISYFSGIHYRMPYLFIFALLRYNLHFIIRFQSMSFGKYIQAFKHNFSRYIEYSHYL